MNIHAPDRPDPAAIADVVDKLVGDFGERVVTSRAVREHHGHGEGLSDAALPDVVVFAHSNEEVASIVRVCNLARVPVIAFGVGTSLEGHVAALYGGVCLDLSQMNRVLEVNADDLDCRVQAGVTREQLNAELKGTGLFFPIDPGANATIGGMAATRASGTNAVRYGTMRENVLGFTVVTADGRIIKTGGRARKSSAGYDLTRLFIGAEGTLGIITEIALRLYGVPEAIAAAVCQFDSLENAVNTVIVAMQTGIPVARIELLDDVQMDACIRYSKLDGFAVAPTLFFEFHGSAGAVDEQAAAMQAITAEFGGSAFQWATQAEDRTRLWKARHAAYYAALALKPGMTGFATDACVPISRLAQCIMETKADIAKSGLTAPILGHVGDGNFHLVILFDNTISGERARAEALATSVSLRAIAMGGTCTGEHGIGWHKLDVLVQEHGEAVDLMRSIKRALDPHNIMNPGKTVPLD
jgi:D-lactate dehydrogenase (cytochrome)